MSRKVFNVVETSSLLDNYYFVGSDDELSEDSDSSQESVNFTSDYTLNCMLK